MPHVRFPIRVALLLGAALGSSAVAASELDRRFSGDGFLALGFQPDGGDFDRVLSSCPGPDGSQIVTGVTAASADYSTTYEPGSASQLTTLRIRDDGSLDTGFAGQGFQRIVATTGRVQLDQHLALCVGGGRSVIARQISADGSDCADGGRCALQVLRLDDQGRLDPSFASGGILRIEPQTLPGGDVGALAGGVELSELNARSDGTEYLLTAVVSAATDARRKRPVVMRIGTDGRLLAGRVISVAGLDLNTVATAADYQTDGQIRIVGTGTRSGEACCGNDVLFIGRLAADDLAPVAMQHGDSGDWLTHGGRMLRPDVMVVGASVRPPDSIPGLPRTPILLVVRPGHLNQIRLPPTGTLRGKPAVLVTAVESVAPLDDRSVLFSAPLFSYPDYFGLGIYLAKVHVGSTPGEDRVLTDFGDSGALRLTQGSTEAGCNGSAGSHDFTRTTLWQGRPLILGDVRFRCDGGAGNQGSDADWQLIRLQPHLLRHGFE